ncbi:lipopolysaccharide biosynthesis protein [Microbulbifer pacificus]|uniref:Membrane protein involved in the export of O-antigen and teichoic acid n=1 Tax=Microbulbifer pacificus TaxID=407164 RepID=A0AAU0MXV0_9GAMM|nr:hypothetical protein [Microbulbifer pacificus]WOX05440.1 hypothetical protein R5R33_17130 [Microbulbifer pacificus]
MKHSATKELVVSEQRATRGRNLRLSLATSLVARMSGVLLQVITLPIAASSLGAADFTIYAMLGAFLAAMALSNLGMGQATTLRMAEAIGAGDNARAHDTLRVSLIIVGGIAFALALAAVGLILFTPIMTMVFANQLNGSVAPNDAALFACAVFFVTQVVSVFEAAQLAQQRQYRLNLAMAVGTLLAAASVFWVSNHNPSVLSILIAVHLPVTVARIYNAIVVWVQFCSKYTSSAGPVKIRAGAIFKDGLHFVSGTTVSNFLTHHLSILIVGAFCESIVAASFAAVMNSVLLATVVFNHIMAPLRGALPEAKARGDGLWIRRVFINVTMMNSLVGFAIAFLFFIFGTAIFQYWYGGSVVPWPELTRGAGVYILVLTLEITFFGFVTALGYLRFASICMLAKGVAVSGVVFILSSNVIVHGLMWVISAISFFISMLPLAVFSWRLMRPECAWENSWMGISRGAK